MAILPDFTLPGSDPNDPTQAVGGGDFQTRQRLAQQLLQQGVDTSPIQSPWQGAARLAQALAGTIINKQADDQQRQATAAMLKAWGGGAPAASAAPATAGAPPAAPADKPVQVASLGGAPTSMPSASSAPAKPGFSILGGDGKPAAPVAPAENGMLPVYGDDATMVPNNLPAKATGYSPQAGGPQAKMEGGYASSVRGPDGQATVRTLDDFRAGKAPYVTLAGDPAFYGKSYTIPEITYRSGGQTYTLKDVPAVVHDTGSVFKGAPEGRFDIALGRDLPFAESNQPISGVQFLPGGSPSPTASQFAGPGAPAAGGPAAAPPPQTPAAESAPTVSPQQQALAAALRQPTPAPAQADPRALAAALMNPALPASARQVGMTMLAQQLAPQMDFQTTADGTIIGINKRTGAVAPVYQAPVKPVALNPDQTLVNPMTGQPVGPARDASLPPGVKPTPDYDNWRIAVQNGDKRSFPEYQEAIRNAGASRVTIGAEKTYEQQLAEGLGKAHAGLANGVEDAQARARDLAAMQGAIDAIQRNGGSTGGLGQQQILDLKKSINAGLASIGIEKPFDEKDLSDKEFLTKFNQQLAGAQAKNAVGARVTNFEMATYLKSNPGLEMSVTGNQRLIGIQAQIEQRNIAVGNAIRQATAQAIGQGKKIDPQTVQKIITDYDEAHHIKDPITGQDLTQSYALPEFQTGGTNPGLAGQHEQNLKKMRVYDPATGTLK